MNFKDVKAITIPECIVANNSQTFSSTTKTSSNAWFNYYPTSTSALGLCKAIRIKGKFHVYGNSYSWLGVWYNSDAQGGESQVTLNTGSGWVETPFDITCYLVRDDWINNTLWNVFAFGGGSSNYRWIRAVVAKTNNNNLDFYTQSDTTNEYFRVTVDSIEIGVKKITDSNNVVLWEEKSAKVLESITLSGQTTSLNRGASFSFGGTVTANYSDGSTADVTSSTTFSGYNMSTAGTYTVTASYTEDGVTKTATYTLTVNKAWSTIWSGSKTVKTTGSTTTGKASNFAQSIAGKGTSPQIRVTFSMSNSGQSGMTYSYYINSTTLTTSKPSSPQTFNVNSTRLIGERSTSGYVWKEVYLGRTLDNTNKLVKFNLSAYDSGSSTVYGDTIQLTVTKIEQFY